MQAYNPLIRASEKILTECLALPTGAGLIIFADETTLEPAKILAETALQLDLHPILTYFTVRMQETLGAREIPSSLEAVLRDSAAALICLNNSPECLPFRNTIRISAWNSGCKVAHMPGILPDTLLLADVNYQTLSAQCELLALALVKGQKIFITSYDQHGRPYHLEASLHPWVRFPIVSDALIQPGSWGNVPSGETFVAPLEGTAEGQIVIDGSIPGHVVQPGEELILSFRKGVLVDWTPQNNPTSRHLQNTQIRHALTNKDPYWTQLGEIGIGVNPGVHQLTGNPLLDEKKYGSLHIALGENVGMGGNVTSSIHCDMVCQRPKVLIDEKVILENGNILLNVEDWCEDYRELYPPESWHGGLKITRSAANAHNDRQGRLKRSWDTSSGRVCSVPVGNEDTARKAAILYQKIGEGGRRATIRDLISETSPFDLPQVLQLCYLLSLYGLVRISNHASE